MITRRGARARALARPHQLFPSAARNRWTAGFVRGLFAVAGILVFILALQLIRTGAKGLLPLLDTVNVDGPVNALGFGWLFAYVVLSGSPVAAIGVSLLSGGTFSEGEAFAVIAGSRLGASFIVLAVGFFLYIRGRRNADGLVIGVIALLTTFTTQGPAFLLGSLIIEQGWLDGVHFATPSELLNLIDRLYGPPVREADDLLPKLVVFVLGVGVLLGSFSIFDRALPQPAAEADELSRMHALFRRWPLMFLLGSAVTMVTLSVSISITVLVPLALKGYVKREHVIPYVMGANITTFVDTLFASVLLGGERAFTVVLVEMISVGLVSLLLLCFAYGPYSRTILGVAGWTTRRPRNLGVFLAAIVALPALLLFV